MSKRYPKEMFDYIDKNAGYFDTPPMHVTVLDGKRNYMSEYSVPANFDLVKYVQGVQGTVVEKTTPTDKGIVVSVYNVKTGKLIQQHIGIYEYKYEKEE